MPSVFEKKLLLLTAKVTLTVVTNPSGATCTLTCNGVAYNQKTLTVPTGSVVYYSVYHSTYGTSSGSVLMNADKTMTFTGSYTTSTVEQAWSNPIMTAEQTPGGSVFAAFMDSTYSNRYAYLMFDGQTGSGHFVQTAGTLPHYLGFYNPDPVRITSLSFNWYKASAAYYSPKTASIEASNDGNTYTTLQTFSESSNPASTTLTNFSNTAYKYYRVYGTDGGVSTTYACEECYASGYTQVQSYSYYWEIT